MMLMTERNGLLARNARLRNVTRAINHERDYQDCSDYENRPKDSDSGDGIRTAMKDLRHERLALTRLQKKGIPNDIPSVIINT